MCIYIYEGKWVIGILWKLVLKKADQIWRLTREGNLDENRCFWVWISAILCCMQHKAVFLRKHIIKLEEITFITLVWIKKYTSSIFLPWALRYYQTKRVHLKDKRNFVSHSNEIFFWAQLHGIILYGCIWILLKRNISDLLIILIL